MKGMKWFLVLGLSAVLAGAGAGCDSGDDPDPLIGIWNLETISGVPKPADSASTFEFLDSGAAVQTFMDNGVTTSVRAWLWSAENGILTVTDTDTSVSETSTFSIAGNTLTLVTQGTTFVFTRR